MKSSSSSTSLNLSSVARLPPRWPAAGGTLVITPFSAFQPRSSGLVEGGAAGAAGAGAGAVVLPARPPPRPPPPARTVHPVKSLPLKSDFQGPAVWAEIVGDVLATDATRNAASTTHTGAPTRVTTDFMWMPSGLCIIHRRPFMTRRLPFLLLFQI